MLLSELLIASGPITYVGCWIIVILILLFIEISSVFKVALLTYAVAPVGAICQTSCGLLLSLFGL